MKVTTEVLKGLLGMYRFNFSNEVELQNAIAELFQRNNIKFVRELTLRKDRIDFVVGRIGIEVKIKGSQTDVLRQLHRYAQDVEFEELILITTKMKHTMPAMLNNKKLTVINIGLNQAL